MALIHRKDALSSVGFFFALFLVAGGEEEKKTDPMLVHGV